MTEKVYGHENNFQFCRNCFNTLLMALVSWQIVLKTYEVTAYHFNGVEF